MKKLCSLANMAIGSPHRHPSIHITRLPTQALFFAELRCLGGAANAPYLSILRAAIEINFMMIALITCWTDNTGMRVKINLIHYSHDVWVHSISHKRPCLKNPEIESVLQKKCSEKCGKNDSYVGSCQKSLLFALLVKKSLSMNATVLANTFTKTERQFSQYVQYHFFPL